MTVEQTVRLSILAALTWAGSYNWVRSACWSRSRVGKARGVLAGLCAGVLAGTYIAILLGVDRDTALTVLQWAGVPWLWLMCVSVPRAFVRRRQRDGRQIAAMVERAAAVLEAQP